MIGTWTLIVPEPLSILFAISVPLAHRGERGRRAIIVIIAALLSLDVRVDRACDRLVRSAGLVLIKAAPQAAPRAGASARPLPWEARSARVGPHF
jgi:hypothetical protein